MLINEYVAIQLHKMREVAQQTQYENRAVTEVINEFKEQQRINKLNKSRR